MPYLGDSDSTAKGPPELQRIVDAMAGIPAFIRNGRLDILYATPLAAALYSEQFSDPVQPPSSARFAFLHPRAREFYVDWEQAAHDVVAQLRGEAGRNPLRPHPVRLGRAALHAERRVPGPLGKPRRSRPPVETKHVHHPLLVT